jgi:antitoxin (DNA-binding transcriptional repressor) of toxin-antitoxin stability system
MKATTKDLRLHARELLAATDRGETVYISWRGKRRAVLTRWQEDKAHGVRESRNPAYGIRADQTENVDEQIRRLRKPRKQP